MALAALYAQVFSRPTDLAARRVLADALLEAGSPHGEFLALQLATSARCRKRAQKLLARHADAFLGPLAVAVRRPLAHFRHGFVVDCVAHLDAGFAQLEAWATVERVWWISSAQAPAALASPHFRSLREVVVLPFSVDRPQLGTGEYFVAAVEAALAQQPRKVRVRTSPSLRRFAEQHALP